MIVCSITWSLSTASRSPQCGQRSNGTSIRKSTSSSGGRTRQRPSCPPLRPGRFGDGERLLSGRAKGAAPRIARLSSSAKRCSCSASRASSSAIRSACRSTKSTRAILSRESSSPRFIGIVNHAVPSFASQNFQKRAKQVLPNGERLSAATGSDTSPRRGEVGAVGAGCGPSRVRNPTQSTLRAQESGRDEHANYSGTAARAGRLIKFLSP